MGKLEENIEMLVPRFDSPRELSLDVLLIFQLQFGRGFPLFFTTGNAKKSFLRSFLSYRVPACFRNYNSPASEANRALHEACRKWINHKK